MKTIIIGIGMLVFAIFSSQDAYAVGNGASAEKISAQNGKQAQVNNLSGDQVQTQQKLQDGSAEGEPVQNQEQKRSQVANAVQEMLQIAERNGGVGEQIRTIAQNQNSNQEGLQDRLEKIQGRGRFYKFLIGPNYGEINNAEKLLEENQEKIEELQQIKEELVSTLDIQSLEEQIQVLEESDLEFEKLLTESKKGISLFGWVSKLFAN